MPIEILADQGAFRLTLPQAQGPQIVSFADLPALLAAHLCQWEPPQRLEACAAALVQSGFEPHHAKRFATAVMRWGGGHRLVGRFDDQNEDHDFANCLRAAFGLVQAGDVPAAVTAVAQCAYLGQSFASKLVGFLAPRQAVILDSVIRTKLGYRESIAGYTALLQDCLAIQAAVFQRHPHLRVCDIEAAIFAKLQGY